MTSEEIKATIVRLRECDNRTLPTIFDALTYSLLGKRWCNNDVIEAIVALLEQADPDTHIELPRDADGKTVRIGDMMECDRLPNGCHVCGEVKSIGDGVVWLSNVRYSIHAEYLHHHAKTLDEVLRECCDAYHAAVLDEEGDTVRADVLMPSQVLLKYVTEIREVVANEAR